MKRRQGKMKRANKEEGDEYKRKKCCTMKTYRKKMSFIHERE